MGRLAAAIETRALGTTLKLREIELWFEMADRLPARAEALTAHAVMAIFGLRGWNWQEERLLKVEKC